MTIKINLITYNNKYGLTNDMILLARFLKRTFRDRVEIKIIDFFHYKAPQADINIFLETVSKILFKHAKINILIPNQEWFYRTWTPYLEDIDYVWVKSKYALNIFQTLLKDRRDCVKFIGWRSLDRFDKDQKKDFTKFLHICGRSKHKQTQMIIDSWEKDFPELTILYSPKDVDLEPRKDLDNIKFLTERLSEEELNKLLNQHGVHVCCSETEGYGHYIHEAKSTQSVLITTDAPPMSDYVDNDMGYLVKYSNKKPLKKHLGSKYILDTEDFKRIIKEIKEQDPEDLRVKGEKARESYLKEARKFENNLKELFIETFKEATSVKTTRKEMEKNKKEMEEMMKEENLPYVSIITPTYNRRHMFRVAISNFINFRYPSDKMEWVIVDDGSDKIGDLVKEHPELKDDPRVKYYQLDEKKPIGFKRNYCVEKASHDIIVCMDDDDYYPSNSVKLRVLELLKSGKDCVTCSSIGCFEINKFVSMVNVPPHRLSFSERISEASLCFKKSFWEQHKFKDTSAIGEAKEFLDGCENQTVEISWEGVLVALLHNRNTSDKIIIDQSPNGCHYGWSDELFLFITNLDKELTPEETKNKKKKKPKKKDEDDDGHLDYK